MFFALVETSHYPSAFRPSLFSLRSLYSYDSGHKGLFPTTITKARKDAHFARGKDAVLHVPGSLPPLLQLYRPTDSLSR